MPPHYSSSTTKLHKKRNTATKSFNMRNDLLCELKQKTNLSAIIGFKTMHAVCRRKACCNIYIIYNDVWNHHLGTIKAFFDKLSEAKLTINIAKSEF